jgi:hypothetical protein
MKLRTTLVTLVGALALLVWQAAAFAAGTTVTVNDPDHDLTTQVKGGRSIDIQSLDYARVGRRIVITYHLLGWNKITQETNFVSTAKVAGVERYGLDSAGGDTAYIVDLRKHASIPCGRANADRHRATRSVTISFPSRCIGSPRSIALKGTTALLADYGPIAEDTTRYGRAISLR